jgi:arsenate reductase-like glutaredoxin family protein
MRKSKKVWSTIKIEIEIKKGKGPSVEQIKSALAELGLSVETLVQTETHYGPGVGTHYRATYHVAEAEGK